MSQEYGPQPDNPEIDHALEDSIVAAAQAETTDLAWDLANIATKRSVLEAANLEGIDVGLMAALLHDTADPSINGLSADVDSTLQVLNGAAQVAKLTSYLRQQQLVATMVEDITWARRNIDDGTDPAEVKVVTQLEVYANKSLNPEDKLAWLNVINRMIPEVPGLDPDVPDTALEIDSWIELNY